MWSFGPNNEGGAKPTLAATSPLPNSNSNKPGGITEFFSKSFFGNQGPQLGKNGGKQSNSTKNRNNNTTASTTASTTSSTAFNIASSTRPPPKMYSTTTTQNNNSANNASGQLYNRNFRPDSRLNDEQFKTPTKNNNTRYVEAQDCTPAVDLATPKTKKSSKYYNNTATTTPVKKDNKKKEEQSPQKTKMIPIPNMPTKRYDIIDWVGGGGEGNVFRAYDRVSSQEVAVKVYGTREHPEVPGKSFKKETGVLREIKGRICPAFYDSGVTEDGCDFAVMEFLGRSLRQGVTKPCNKASVHRFAIQAINLLEQLHKQQYMHHDVKPQNIVFSRDQGKSPQFGSNKTRSTRGGEIQPLEQNKESENVLDQKVILVDFGMSFPIDDDEGVARKVQRAKARFCGSMDYSSRVSRMRVTPSRRDDMESLGYVLLWCLLGNKAYKQWRATWLEPLWEMMAQNFYDGDTDIYGIFDIPSRMVQQEHLQDPRRGPINRGKGYSGIFINRHSMGRKAAPPPTVDPEITKQNVFDFVAGPSRDDDLVEGNFPKIDREKTGTKVLFFILYCQSLKWNDRPDYDKLRSFFDPRTQEVSGEDTVPEFMKEVLVFAL